MQNIKCSVSNLSFTHTSFTTEFSSFSFGLNRVNIAWIYYSLLFPLTRCPTKSGNCLIKFISEMLNCASWQQSSPTSLHVPSAPHFPFSSFTCGGIWNQIYYRTYHEQLQQQHQQKQHVLLGLWFPGAWDTADVPSFCDCCLFLISATSVPKWL